MDNFGIYLKNNGCYGNKNGPQNRLKILNFEPNLRLFETEFFKN